VKVIDNTNGVMSKHNSVKDRALAMAAGDIKTLIHTSNRTPHLHGLLKASARPERIGFEKYRIVVPKAYAAYQERGMRYDGSHVIRKYTTPGTGKGWFNYALQTVAKNFPNIIRQASKLEGF
jgi:hypothetical protein